MRDALMSAVSRASTLKQCELLARKGGALEAAAVERLALALEAEAAGRDHEALADHAGIAAGGAEAGAELAVVELALPHAADELQHALLLERRMHVEPIHPEILDLVGQPKHHESRRAGAGIARGLQDRLELVVGHGR